MRQTVVGDNNNKEKTKKGKLLCAKKHQKKKKKKMLYPSYNEGEWRKKNKMCGNILQDACANTNTKLLHLVL